MTKEQKLMQIDKRCGNIILCGKFCPIFRDKKALQLCRNKTFIDFEVWTEEEVDYLLSVIERKERK